MFWNKKGKPVAKTVAVTPAQIQQGMQAMQHASHTHGLNSIFQPGDEHCPACQGNGGYSYASQYTAPHAMGQAMYSHCSFCRGQGHFKPTDIMFQPVKLFKMALQKAQEIQKENERKEAERKQRIKDQIMSKLTDEEQEFLNANR